MRLAPLLTAAIAALALSNAFGQGYPVRPVRVLVGFAPGGVTDVIARIVAPKLAEAWGQPVVVENRPGATGIIAAGLVARAPPDGYTLLVHGGYAENAALHANLPYDPLKDFVHVAPLATQPFVLVASPASGVKSVGELVAAAKARPGTLNYSSAGIGSGTHFSGERFRLAVGIDVVHVPYKGGAEALTNTLAGRNSYGFSTITITLPHIRDGRLVALGVTSPQRSALLPDVPTIAEAGVPGFEAAFLIGIWAPAGTPAPVVDQIARDAAGALATAELRERLAQLGSEPLSLPPAEFAQLVRREIEETVRLVKAAGMKPQ
jgi:tripartite-type tricarboxylate transporter receptor subunit TctC